MEALIASANAAMISLNNSKYIAGIMMILMNLGSRYISHDISEFQEAVLSSSILRKIFIFTVFFISTRDIVVSVILTVIFVILISGLFNENSKYCILPIKTKPAEVRITKEEHDYAQSIIQKYKKQNAEVN